MGLALEARGFSFRAGGATLLEDVSFTAPEGVRLAVVGPNGAGKSTLMKAFCRMLGPSDPRLRVFGEPLDRIEPKRLARTVAYVPQALGRANAFTVREFTHMGRYPHQHPLAGPGRRDREAVDRVLDFTGLAPLAGRALDTLSGGELQKALIAAALAQEPRVLLLDEPTAFLDPRQQDQVHALLHRLHAAGGLTLVEVTHDPNRAALASDQVLGLRAGRVFFWGGPGAFMRPEVLAGLYGKDFDLEPHPRTGRIMVLPEAPA